MLPIRFNLSIIFTLILHNTKHFFLIYSNWIIHIDTCSQRKRNNEKNAVSTDNFCGISYTRTSDPRRRKIFANWWVVENHSQKQRNNEYSKIYVCFSYEYISLVTFWKYQNLFFFFFFHFFWGGGKEGEE